LDPAVRSDRAQTDYGATFFNQFIDFRLHLQREGWIETALLREEIQKIPLRHEREETAGLRQMAEIGDGVGPAADARIERPHLLVRQLEGPVEQTELPHQFQSGRMDGVATKVAQEIGMLLQH